MRRAVRQQAAALSVSLAVVCLPACLPVYLSCGATDSLHVLTTALCRRCHTAHLSQRPRGKFVVLHQATVRTKCELASKKAGVLEPDQVMAVSPRGPQAVAFARILPRWRACWHVVHGYESNVCWHAC
eukprot:SAG25_NODE_1384_length_3154_cov_2.977741_1_plen_127_part_10